MAPLSKVIFSVRCWLGERCLRLFVTLMPHEKPVLVQPLVLAGYIPTPFDIQAAKIVERYDVPLVLAGNGQHVCAIYVRETGTC